MLLSRVGDRHRGKNNRFELLHYTTIKLFCEAIDYRSNKWQNILTYGIIVYRHLNLYCYKEQIKTRLIVTSAVFTSRHGGHGNQTFFVPMTGWNLMSQNLYTRMLTLIFTFINKCAYLIITDTALNTTPTLHNSLIIAQLSFIFNAVLQSKLHGGETL